MGFLPPSLTKFLSLLGSQISDLTIRRNLTPVPSHCTIFRLARLPKDYLEKGNILAIQLTSLSKEFELSSNDKKSIPPHLSVWVESLTTPKQAYEFLQANSPNSPRKLILRLKVSQVCKIEGSLTSKQIYPNLLRVIWVHLFKDFDRKLRDRRPSSDGHSGICGLDENSSLGGLSTSQKKLLRKDLRSKLAELASQSSHEILND